MLLNVSFKLSGKDGATAHIDYSTNYNYRVSLSMIRDISVCTNMAWSGFDNQDLYYWNWQQWAIGKLQKYTEFCNSINLVPIWIQTYH